MPTTSDSWRVLHVDDDEGILNDVREGLEGAGEIEGRTCHVFSELDFTKGLDLLRAEEFDLVILDVRAGAHEGAKPPVEEAGQLLMSSIQREQFVPVIFYTGLPRAVEDLNAPPLVQVIAKGEPLSQVADAAKSAIGTGLPGLRRALFRHLREVLRAYMWEFAAKHHEIFRSSGDPTGYIFLLLRRLAHSVVGPMAGQLGSELGIDLQGGVSGGAVHPMRFYVMPPLDDLPHVTGDIYFGDLTRFAPAPPFNSTASVDEGTVSDPELGSTVETRSRTQDNYWILMTPVCDLVTQANGVCKAENVLLCRAQRLTTSTEYKKWKDSSGSQSKPLEKLLKNRREGTGVQPDRYHYLPGAFSVPDLIVDFQEVISVPRSAIGPEAETPLRRLATLDDPFAAELVARFTTYLSRIGTPDLDIDAILGLLT